MVNIAIIIGSTRPNRLGEVVGKWVYENAGRRANSSDARFELIDLCDIGLPLLDEPIPASQGRYRHDHTKKWSEQITAFDAFIFVTPEYNHSTSAALKNAIDFLYKEWNNKVAGFVSYGAAGGTRAVEHLRLIMAEVQVATVRTQVALTLATDFENYSGFKPQLFHLKTLGKLFDDVVAWGMALQSLRRGEVGRSASQPKQPKSPVDQPSV